MVTVVIEHGIEDYEAWKRVFDEHAASRKQHGCVSEELFSAGGGGSAGSGSGGGGTIMNVMRWPDRASAELFLHDPSLHEALTRAGVTGEPRVTFWDSVETTEF
jgi:hypothetical protein